MNIFSKGCKELQEEVNGLQAERDQAWRTSESLEMLNNELRDSSNAFSSQRDAALKVLSIFKTYTPLFMIIVAQLFVKRYSKVIQRW